MTYLIFEYDTFYPGGGLNDLRKVADTNEEVREEIIAWKNESSPGDFLEVVDKETLDYVFKAEFDVDYTDIENVKRTMKIRTNTIGAIE